MSVTPTSSAEELILGPQEAQPHAALEDSSASQTMEAQDKSPGNAQRADTSNATNDAQDPHKSVDLTTNEAERPTETCDALEDNELD
jgi:hypothetical protein